MNLLDHAKYELDLIGMTESGDEMNAAMREHILKMIDTFAEEGHSGFSASYAISLLSKLLKFEPLSPLTGEDSEWHDVSDYGSEPGVTLYQNRRLGSVFKTVKDGQIIDCYDIDHGTVFFSMYYDEVGDVHKSYYTNRKSWINISFPYIPREAEEVWDGENIFSSEYPICYQSMCL